jgi:hypothetical protein
MADSKITALTALTAADPANDMIPIVDVSDTPPASGNTKRISINNILACSPTATLASLNVTGSSIPANGLYLPTTNTLEFSANSLAQYRIAPLGVFSWYDGAGGTRMTLNSTGLGVGVSPSYKLDVNGVARVNSGGDGLFLSSASSPDLYIVGANYYNNNGTEGVQTAARPSWKIEHKNSSDALAYLDIGFRAASAAASAFTSRFKIDGSGNVVSNVTATPPTLATNSQMVFNLTSNTNLRISVRGTDGTTRTANITLA